MTSIFTQDVSAWATVGGTDNFQLTAVEVQRRTGREIGKAILKGIPEDGDIYPAPGAVAEVFVATESATTPWDEDLNTSERIFYGEVMSAKQDKNGVITFEVSSMLDALHRQSVQLEVEDPFFAHAVLTDLLTDRFARVHNNIEDATPLQPYIANPDDFPGGDYQSPWRFGNAERGIPLINAIAHLLESLGGIMWTDKNGIIRFEGYPEHRVWRTPLVVEINSGDSTRNAERVIFEASGTASDLGQGASFVSSQTSHTSEAQIQGNEEEGPPPPTKTLTDDNVSSQEEADQRAYNHAVREDQTVDLGEVTIVGNASIELYDHVIVPEVEYTPLENGIDLGNVYQAGRYKVDGITHKLDASNGFLTTIELTPPIDDTYRRCGVVSGVGFEQQFLEQYSNNITGGVVSLTGNGNEGDEFAVELSGASAVDL